MSKKVQNSNAIENGGSKLIASIVQYSGRKLPFAIFIVAVSSFLEGVGLVLLLPVAEVIFSNDSSGSEISVFLINFLETVGAKTVLQQLVLLCCVFLILILIRAFVLLYRDVLLMRLSQGYVDHIRLRFFGALTTADWPVLKRLQRSHLLDDMTVNVGRIAAAMRFLSQGVVTILLLVAYIVSAFLVNKWVGIILLFISIVTIITASIWVKRVRKLGANLTHGNRKVMEETTRFLDGLKAAKACQAEDEFIERFKQSIGSTRRIATDFVMQQARSRRAIEMIGAVAAVLLLLFGYGILNLTGSELLIMAAIVIRLNPSLVGTLSGLQSIAYALPAFESAEEIRLLASSEGSFSKEPRVQRNGRLDLDGAISLHNASVCMNDEADARPLLTTEDFTIAESGLVHVGGPSGAGKSTFVELLAGLYLPASGKVTRKGLSLDSKTRQAWQNVVAYVPQEPFLFDGTVRENLCWPNIQASDDDLWNVLSIAYADKLVRDLPAQLDEILYDNGNRLSGGQRQRLCIARALLRPSNLIILDESTSAVDHGIESLIIDNLIEIAKHKLVILVSHSEAAQKVATQKIDISDGFARIIE